jgi:hypothetical protein
MSDTLHTTAQEVYNKTFSFARSLAHDGGLSSLYVPHPGRSYRRVSRWLTRTCRRSAQMDAASRQKTCMRLSVMASLLLSMPICI